MNGVNRFTRQLRALRQNQSGLALIEFGLSLPMLTLITMGGFESANLAMVNLRVSQVAMQVADNTSRVRDRIDETDINNIFVGAKLAGASIDIANRGRIIVATVQDRISTATPTNDQDVVWQRCEGVFNPGTTSTNEGDVEVGGVGATGNTIVPVDGSPIIYAEVHYNYAPLFPLMDHSIFNARTIVYRSALAIRDRLDQTMQNGSALSAAQKSTCGYFNAT